MGKLQEAEEAKKKGEEKPKKKAPKHPASTQKESDQGQDESEETGAGPDDQSDADDGAEQSGGESAGAVGQPQAADDETPQQGGAEAPEGGGDQGGDDSDQSAQGGPPSAQGNPSLPTGQAIPVPPGIKDAYDKANTALLSALYGNNHKVAAAVLQGIQPQGPHKIESAARAAIHLFTQLNLRLKLSKQTPQIVLPFTKDIVNNILDLAERGGGIQFSDQEAVAVLGTSLEMVMRIIGVTKQQMSTFQAHMGQAKMQKGLGDYKAALAHTKGARGPTADEQQGGNPPSGPPGASPGGAAPNGPGPNGGTPTSPQQGPGGQPQPGSPVTAAPGPGQSAPPGGMLSQAQPPQAQ